jgi:hypothetical protein
MQGSLLPGKSRNSHVSLLFVNGLSGRQHIHPAFFGNYADLRLSDPRPSWLNPAPAQPELSGMLDCVVVNLVLMLARRRSVGPIRHHD